MEALNALAARRSHRGCVLVDLAGEFDVSAVKELRATLGGALGSARLAFVDLSRVTFIDSTCLEELAVYHQLHGGRLVLCRPSPQVNVGVAACGLEDWLAFHPDEESALRSVAGRAAGALQGLSPDPPEEG